jgi:hypothetical protein
MARIRMPRWKALLPDAAWTALLALLPWWLGLPLLLALAAAVLLLQHRLAVEHARLIPRSLRWGLPGVLFALQRALGGNVIAWGVALLGALVGYTLLAGLEAWLDRDVRRAPAATASAEWPELATAPIGPLAEIIELKLPVWQLVTDELADPQVGQAGYRRAVYADGGYRFVDGMSIDGVGPHASFSPQGRWLVVRMTDDRGTVLWDRECNQLHRLRGWQLCGWHHEQPWLARRDDEMPLALQVVLEQDDD